MIRNMETTSIADVRDTPKSLRVRMGLTQEDVARMARMAVRTVGAAESGGRISLDTAERIAHVVHVSPGFYVDARENERRLNRVANLKSRASEFKKGGRR